MLFTSFWGWKPHEWGAVGWSNAEGRTHRDKLLKRLSDPFICAVYVANNPRGTDSDLLGKIAGFYLLNHETGDREEFTHPVHHGLEPQKWRHSVRAIRAFTYTADPLLDAYEFEPSLRTGKAQSVARWLMKITDPKQIQLLRETRCQEVPV